MKLEPFSGIFSYLHGLADGVGTDLRRGLKDLYYWFAHRLWDRYDYCWTGLEPGYHDVTERMLHVNMQLLVDFVEIECRQDHIDWDAEQGHRQAWADIRAVYLWWTEQRPNRVDPCDLLPRPNYDWQRIGSDELTERGVDSVLAEGRTLRLVCLDTPEQQARYHEALAESLLLEGEWQGEDEDMLCRLMRVRPYLWT